MADNVLCELEPMTAEIWRAILDESLEPEFEPPIRRRGYRHPVHEPFTVLYRTRRVPITQTLNLNNVSLDGVMGKSMTEIPMKTSVEIGLDVEGRRFFMRGTIAHCTGTIGGFNIGIRLSLPKDEPAESCGAEGQISRSSICRTRKSYRAQGVTHGLPDAVPL